MNHFPAFQAAPRIKRAVFRLVLITAALIIPVRMCIPATADTRPTLLLVPFTILSEGDSGFLETAVNRMLTSRLATAYQLLAADAAPLTTKAAARRAGTSHQADWVLFGTVTVIDAQVSTDATLLPLPDGDPVHFSRTGEKKSSVIPHIDALATVVIEAKNSRLAAVPEQGTQAPVKPLSTPGPAADHRPASVSGAVPAPAAVTREWKSRPLKEAVHALGTGDFTGDAKTDLITGSNHTLTGYTVDQEQLVKLFSYTEKNARALISCGILDADADGTPEIYAAWITRRNRIRSAVFHFSRDNKSLTPVKEKLPWLFRITTGPDGSPLLAGQKQDKLSGALSPDIYRLFWENGNLNAAPMDLPDTLQVTSFTFGPVNRTQETGILGLVAGQRLTAYAADGTKIWANGDRFGGTPLYLTHPDPTEPNEERHVYLRQRVVAGDLNADHIPDILVAQNTDMAGGFLARLKHFKDGRATVLSWTPAGLTPIWSSVTFSGYVSDVAIGDLDNDRKPEIIMAVVSGTGILGKDKETSLYRYTLN
ncbi:MAG: hypothetical protein CSA22_01350 [Deltaproteobacteria bacterium]|nr:MAG: hypothetical protein CSA22_01350 [Deltaproteobacteria bacterium]